MLKAKYLKKGDKVAIVCLSRGLLGEKFVKHEVDIAIKRLKDYGLIPVVMPNANKGMKYLEEHPEKRAEDLKQAFLDDEIKGIISAIGGNDTYRIFPYLMEDSEFIDAVSKNPKIFSGFSDTTMDHLMLYKLGLSTFYGPCFLVDLAELDKEMLPYTRKYFEKYFLSEDNFEIESSNVWYSDRESYDVSQVGVSRKVNQELHGYEVLNGSGVRSGRLLGGCIDSIYEAMTGSKFNDELVICDKYGIVPSKEEWNGKIMFLEPSDEKVSPDNLEIMLNEFKSRGIFDVVSGVIVGKPIDEVYYDEYKDVFKRVFSDLETPVLYNVNFGHSVPRCVIPYGIMASVDYDNKTINIVEKMLEGE